MFFGFFYRINYFFYKKIFLFLFFSTEFFFLSFILYVYDKSANKGQKAFFFILKHMKSFLFKQNIFYFKEINFYENTFRKFFKRFFAKKMK
jgi:hypothetical protein